MPQGGDLSLLVKPLDQQGAAVKKFLIGACVGVVLILSIGSGAAFASEGRPKMVPASVTSLKIVKFSSVRCSYNALTHSAGATGRVTWEPANGGGALGTVTAKWIGKGRHSVSAVTPELFDGLWTLSVVSTKPVTHCSVSGQFAPPTAESVVTFFQNHGFPITGVIAYNVTTDPNHLLGRPNGYLSKVAWQDTRIDQTYQPEDPGDVKWGGSIEVFSDSTKALARANYLGAISQAASALGDGYDYLLGSILVRLSATLIPTQAMTYAQAIPGLTLFQYSGTAGTPTPTTTAP
jgi:hypothetical protein